MAKIPRPTRQVVMKQILRACARAPRSADELAKRTGSSRESIHVLTHRLRQYGQLETLNPGTRSAVHVTVRPPR